MTVYLLPVPHLAHVPLEPVTHLSKTLEHITTTPGTVCKDAAERRELLYYDAVAHLCATYPDDQQQGVWDRQSTQLLTGAALATANAAELRTATLAVYGLACDRAVSKGRPSSSAWTWINAAKKALETYRRRTLLRGEAA